jgi:hypothetical protein
VKTDLHLHHHLQSPVQPDIGLGIRSFFEARGAVALHKGQSSAFIKSLSLYDSFLSYSLSLSMLTLYFRLCPMLNGTMKPEDSVPNHGGFGAITAPMFS